MTLACICSPSSMHSSHSSFLVPHADPYTLADQYDLADVYILILITYIKISLLPRRQARPQVSNENITEPINTSGLVSA